MDRKINIDGFVNPIEKPLEELAQRVCDDFDGNIEGICVAGSALTSDFVAGKSRINTILIFREESLELLDGISAMGKLFKKHNFDMPLITTLHQIERSCDVFGVEYLDISLNHKTILGNSPFESLIIDKSDVRMQCERELKADMIRLRQGYIASKFGGASLSDILISCGSGLVPYLRAMLWLCDKQRQPLTEPTIDVSSDLLGFGGEPLKKIIALKHKKARLNSSEQKEAMRYMYSLVILLSGWVDGYDVLSSQ